MIDTLSHGNNMKRITILCLLFILLPLHVFSQREEKKIFVLKTDNPIEVDGFLNEPIWKKAYEANELFQTQSERKSSSLISTKVKILYDDNFIYFGFSCYDSKPEEIAALLKVRDDDLRDDDSVYILIETSQDTDIYYYFGTNLIGTQFDGIITIDGRTANPDWNGIWKSAGQKTDFGWSAEAAIDLRSLKYESGKDKSLGLSLSRIVPRMLESSFWTGPLDPAFKVAQLGRIKRINLAKAESKIKITPHIINTSEEGTKSEYGGGLDVRYDFSQMVSSHLAIYPDFATVEADQELINLTPFDLYVPEKRDFFLEGSDIYNQKIRLFYSKRIPDIYGGLKLNGRAGGFELSGMSAQAMEDEYTGEGEANFSVFRLKQNVTKSSSIGFLAANRLIDGKNIGTAGIDTLFQFADTFNVMGQFAVSYGDYKKENIAFFLRPSFDSETFHIHAGYTHLGERFGDNVNRVGFIKDDNRREVDTGIGIAFVKDKGDIEEFRFDSNYNVYFGMDGALRGWRVDGGLTCDFKNKFTFFAQRAQEYYAQDVEIPLISGEDYRNHETKLGIAFNRKEWELAILSFTFGQSFGHSFSLLGISKNLQVSRNLAVEYELGRAYFGYGRFYRNQFVHALRATNYITENLMLKLFYQANTRPDNHKVTFEVLFSYRFLPPSGFLQVAYRIGDPRFGMNDESKENTMYLKMGYSF